MSDDQVNPYAPPQAESDVELASASRLHGLAARSIILMVVLTFVTLGLYINYWVHRLAGVLNHKLEGQRISMVLVGTFWLLSLTSITWIAPEIVTEDNPTIVRIGSMLTRADMMFTVIMAFTIRSRLNTLTLAPRGHPGWFHGLWTFLFGIYYLQWKINRNLRSSEFPKAHTAVTSPSEFRSSGSTDETS